VPIPDYQSIMLPLLQLAADGQEYAFRNAIEVLADQFGLTPEERDEMLPSGTQRQFDNRVGWARTYLSKAGLLQVPRRGFFRITDRGRDVLSANPDRIDVAYLKRFPEFLAFQSPGRAEQQRPSTPEQQEQTPEERLESSYQELRDELAQELLGRIKRCSPEFFERLVVDLLVAMGYGGTRKDAGRAVGRRGDGGIDGIINEDRLGLDVVYIQAKRWEGTVGSSVVRDFTGSLEERRAQKGVLMTTSRYSQEASDHVDRIGKRVVLIDGERLAQLMIDHGVGVTEGKVFAVRRLDSDYFEEE